jgi:hypothetical protein
MVLPALAVAGGTFLVNLKAAYDNNEISRQQYEEGLQALKEYERTMRNLRPDETWQDIKPELLQEMAKFSPEVAAFVQENAPELITEPQSQTERTVQREALQKYAAMAETGRDVISEAQREQALFEADARAKARREQLMGALRRQGQLGSGAGLVAQLQGEQEERQMARQAGLQGVQEAELRRRQALGQAASLAGQIRGQNLNVESANVGTMNAYNQRMANARNLYNQYAANTRNQAQAINQQREAQRMQYNLGLTNEAAKYNREQALAARERARAYDAALQSNLFNMRRGLESGKFDAERQLNANIATGLSSATSAGLSTYSGLKGLELAQERNNLLRQGVTPTATQQVLSPGTQAAAPLMLQSPEETDFETRVIPANMPRTQVFNPYEDTPEALDEYGDVDWRTMQARARRNKGS